jgi:ubiquitin-like 1-activating enzyme E1 B
MHCTCTLDYVSPFSQLFGATDPDEEVSPDTADPEAAEEKKAGDAVNGPADGEGSSSATKDGNVVRVSTRQWATDCEYDPKKLFVKLFNEDIKYLLTMDKLWQKRTPPVPLEWEELATVEMQKPETGEDIKDQNLWSLPECVKVFENSIEDLKNQLKVICCLIMSRINVI